MDSSGRFPVGRLAGVVVALGLGAGVLTGPTAVAWADTSDDAKSASADDPSTPSSEAPDNQKDDQKKDDQKKDDQKKDDQKDDQTDGDGAEPAEAAEATEPDPPDLDVVDEKDSGSDTHARAAALTAAKPVRPDEVSAEPEEPDSSNADVPDIADDPDIDVASGAPAVQPPQQRVAQVHDSAEITVAAPAPRHAPEPAATLLSTVVAAILSPFATNEPAAPPPPPIPLTAMALARREFDGALMTTGATAVESAITPLAATAVTSEEAMFTGQPSLVSQVVVAGLRLVKPVLSLFGLELNGTTARIPFFTDGVPPFFVTFGLRVSATEYEGWKVWTLAPPDPTDKVIVAVHGGSFISAASLFHWWTYSDIARDTGATVVVPMYPLANAEGTGGTAKTVIPVAADFIADQVEQHGAENVSVLGDSAGGSIALAAAQQLVIRCNGDQTCLAETLPGRMVLLSPALDAGVTNPDVATIDDPLLNPELSKRNGQWWAKGLETDDDPDGTKNPLASPIYGSLADLPPIVIYAGSLDSRTPDILVLQQKAATTPGAEFSFELRNGQIHDWTIFPFLPDAHVERPNIYRDLGLIEDTE